MLKIGIIGYGAIGRDVAEGVAQGKAGRSLLAGILVRNSSPYDVNESLSGLLTDDEDEFYARGLDVVVECAGHEAIYRYGRRTLLNGSDLIVVSVGAFSDNDLFHDLMEKARESGRRILVPSAAIGGLDRIAAASVGPMEEVTLITRKPTKAWVGTAIEQRLDLVNLTEAVCIFDGVARDAARLFPESVNVSAALSLAGIGFDETKVKVYVDPTLVRNTHEIQARGKFGQVKLQIENTPSLQNPKTGCIVAMSVIKTLRDMTASFVIGI